MKKIMTILVTAMLMMSLTDMTARAQGSFWSGWSVGCDAAYSHQLDEAVTDGPHPWNLTHASDLGGELFFTKQISDSRWDYKFGVTMPGVFSHNYDDLAGMFGHRAGDSCANVGYDRYMTISPMQFNWNFLRGLRWSAYTTFGGGLSVGRYLDTTFAFEKGRIGVDLAAQAGLGLRWNIGRTWQDVDNPHGASLFIEAVADVVRDIPNMFDDSWEGINTMVKIGYAWNFGLTNADKYIKKHYVLVNSEEYRHCLEYADVNDSLAALADSLEARSRLARICRYDYYDSLIKAKDDTIRQLRTELVELKDVNEELSSNPTVSILFDNNSAVVSKSEMSRVKMLTELMKADTSAHYVLVGTCDNSGSEEYNQRLSERRAAAVKKALMRCGVAKSQLETTGYGEMATEGVFTAPEYSINRRVSIYKR